MENRIVGRKGKGDQWKESYIFFSKLGIARLFLALKMNAAVCLVPHPIEWNIYLYPLNVYCNLAFGTAIPKEMHDRHTNREKYFQEQVLTTKKYVIPLLQEFIGINEDTSILEIGCGEGGNLKPFLDLGCRRVVGVDLSKPKIELARNYFSTHPAKDNLELISSDIFETDHLGQFDIIIARDVIEHIHGQGKFMQMVQRFLAPEGKFFLGFPPWYNPFGGHQQMCTSKVLSKTPWFHILPLPVYQAVLKLFGEPERKVAGLSEVKATGISIERFERILKNTGYKIDKKVHYLFNPNYEAKFGLPPKKQFGLISAIPFVRNVFTTAMYYVVSLKEPGKPRSAKTSVAEMGTSVN